MIQQQWNQRSKKSRFKWNCMLENVRKRYLLLLAVCITLLCIARNFPLLHEAGVFNHCQKKRTHCFRTDFRVVATAFTATSMRAQQDFTFAVRHSIKWNDNWKQRTSIPSLKSQVIEIIIILPAVGNGSYLDNVRKNTDLAVLDAFNKVINCRRDYYAITKAQCSAFILSGWGLCRCWM